MNLATPDEPASAFLRALATAAGRAPAAAPAWLLEQRRAALAAVLRDGLPGPREERWKYTPLRALERRDFSLPPAEGAEPPPGPWSLDGVEGPRLVFVDGHVRADLSSLDALPPGVECEALSARLAQPDADGVLRSLFDTPVEQQPADAFLRINAALAADGAVLRVAPGTVVEAPLQLVFAGSAAAAPLLWSLRHLVELGEGASLTLVERWLDAPDSRHIGNAVATLRLGRGARLRHLRLQQGAAGATAIARTGVQLAEGAEYHPLALELGAGLSRHEWTVALAGRGASTSLRGVVLAAGRQQVDTRYQVEHAVGDTRSDTLWRAIAADRARSAFHGGIHIAAGADGSDASLETKNLLLSDQAEIDAQPVLEIDADEVKASHGATVGQLDPGALFYLRSRGVPEAEARQLLVQAFCAEVLERAGLRPGADADPLARAVAEAIRGRLPALGQPA